jgi:D-alanyl-D-alanine dipeptidase
MELTLKAVRDERLGILLKSYSFSGASTVNLEPKSAARYTEPLLRLFASFKAYCANKQNDPAHFQLDASEKKTKEILEELLSNCEWSKQTKKRKPEKPGPWFLLIYRVKSPKKGSKEPPPLFHSLETGVQFSPGILSGRDVTIILDDKPLPLDNDDNVKAFFECFELCKPENEGVFDSHCIRKSLVYSIKLSDKPTYPLADIFSNPLVYRYFDATLSFSRLSFTGYDHFTVSLVQQKPKERHAPDPHKALYREVFSVDNLHERALAQMLDKAANASAKECYEHLKGAFTISAKVNDKEVPLSKVERVGVEFLLRYDLPKELQTKLRLNFDFQMTGFFSRAQNSYPIVISEATVGAKLTFNCPDPDIVYFNYFLGAKKRVSSKGPPINVQNDEIGRNIHVDTEHLLFPGEGVMAHWTKVERVAHVELVDVTGSEYGILAEEDFLFLVRSAAEKLRSVSNSLRVEPRKLAVKVWAAYRSPSHNANHTPAEQNGHICTRHESHHSRACSVDVTLVDQDGNELEMPTRFMASAEHASRTAIEKCAASPAKDNYETLRRHMKGAGFEAPPDSEWWHFVDEDWRKHPVLDLDSYRPPVRAEAPVKQPPVKAAAAPKSRAGRPGRKG